MSRVRRTWRSENTPYLASIPVVIWTSSEREVDMMRVYERGAAAMKQCAIAIQGSWDQVWLPGLI